MSKGRRIVLATLGLGILMLSLSASSGASVLMQYMQTEDPAYTWRPTSQTLLPDDLLLVDLQLTSQRWHGIRWQHTLRLLLPRRLGQKPPLVFLWITGTGNEERELWNGRFMARKVRAPVMILHDIPNQPLFEGLEEDDLLAYTFVRSMETRDPTWLLLLPMVKGVVRAMDAGQEFLQQEYGTPVAGFVLAGASKRGWTSWLTAGVDPRVRGIAPVVYDNLNLPQQMRHQLEVWGRFSDEISEYTERSLPQRLLAQDQQAQALSAIVDPFTYRARLTLPKLLVIGTNDRYWPLDALNLYYSELRGKTYLLYVPNAGHDLGAHMESVLNSISAFFLSLEGRLPFPRLSWETRDEDSSVTLSISSDLSPQTVRIWIARSQSRDFRNAYWQAFPMHQGFQGYAYTLRREAASHVAFFGEAVYQALDIPFSLTTTVRLVPPLRGEGEDRGREK
ncbi:MAG: phenylacetic acid degradation protein [Nitrospinota bacterium]|nr:MAG: phenylacetic acid degradation protein [Nitrospinota bacterium]